MSSECRRRSEAAGWALSFDGVDDHVVLPTTLESIVSAMTVELWVQPTSQQTGIIFERDAPCGSIRLFWAENTVVGQAYPETGCSDGVTVRAASTLDAWHHIAMVIDDRAVRLFVDGVGPESATLSSDIVWARDDLDGTGLGVLPRSFDDPIQAFTGTIDEVRISRSARYDATFSPPDSLTPDGQTVAVWQFDEGSGTALADAAGGRAAVAVGTTWVPSTR